MQWYRVGRCSAAILAAVALFTVGLGGCSKSDPVSPNLGTPGTPGGGPPTPPPPGGPPAPPPPGGTFTPNSTNRFLPLRAGTTWHYRSSTSKGIQTQTVSVTSQTEMIGTANTRVVTTVVELGGNVIERTRDFLAMDGSGNVWSFGRERREMNPATGAELTVGSWRAGTAGARAGRVMLARPDRGDTFAGPTVPGVSASEVKVLSTNADASGVPAAWAKDVLKVQVTSSLDPNMRWERYYSPTVGLVLEVNMNGGRTNRLQKVDVGLPTGP